MVICYSSPRKLIHPTICCTSFLLFGSASTENAPQERPWLASFHWVVSVEVPAPLGADCPSVDKADVRMAEPGEF